MRITIEYEASWRNSFLAGDNNSPLPKNGREFIGSITALKKNEANYVSREVTIDTVMGILNRLIGDQRKLYQARELKYSSEYYFADIESKISFVDVPQYSNEIVYVRNMNVNNDQKSFSGLIMTSDPLLSSEYSNELWGVLELDIDQLCKFIIGEIDTANCDKCDPLHICTLFEKIAEIKPLPNVENISRALVELNKRFPLEVYTRNEKAVPTSMYCSALYIQLERLKERYDVSTAKSKLGGLPGISKRNFTKKDFMKRLTTGNGKIIYGNPYLRKQRVKGEGEVTSMLIKANGRLDITINVDHEKGREIYKMIENAGVSSFYLGKKGLAYVTKIRL